MNKRYFWQVDAFSKNRYYGNPAAVVFDAEGLSQKMMQRIAREMNLSETVFVLPATEPSAHYWSRIFTPQSELPFAGHPTLATAYAMLNSKRVTPEGNVLRQQCGSASCRSPSSARATTCAFP
jgi:PhzF family phenazine biosynthesis protein